MTPLIAQASVWAECAVSCHPNAGLPNEMGEYVETPSAMAADVRGMAQRGFVNIVGGCCGTTPDHIREIAGAVRGLGPRNMPSKSSVLHASGLEAVAIDKDICNFTNVGERTNVAGSRKFARLIAAGDYEAALAVAADQIEGGARIIDVNFDDAMLDSRAEMETFLRHISSDPAVAKAALMIDSSHWETIEAGLKNAQGKCIVNSISLKEGEDAFLKRAAMIKALGAAVVVIAFDEEGQATTYARKIEICERAYSLLTKKAGFDSRDIIFDVNVLPVGTGLVDHSRYGIDFIEAVRWVKRHLPGIRTSGGISNLSFSFRGNNAVREAMHSVFLYHAVAAGLDMGIVNPSMLRVFDQIEPELRRCVEDVILDSDPDATERLIGMASRMQEAKTAAGAGRDAVGGGGTGAGTGGGDRAGAGELSGLSVEERLSAALVKGDSKRLEEDLRECLTKLGRAVDVIEGPLMAGMAKVGEYFGSGRMFLPQVVKSAKTMKNAVAFLQPALEAEGDGAGGHRPKAVLATVKGDVHDIGKNITAIVLACNGFDIIDLGVMVPKEEILREALDRGASVVGVSGLITPSLYQMEELCKEMSARGLGLPLLVGGAATSAVHTAVKLAPLYSHVFYGSDASSTAVLASRLVSDREATEAAEHRSQRALMDLYSSSGRKSLAAPVSAPFPPESFLGGRCFEDIAAKELTVRELLPHFDWSLFAAIWGIRCPDDNEEFQKLKVDALSELERSGMSGGCSVRLSARFDAAHSEGDDIVAWDSADGRSSADPVPAAGLSGSSGLVCANEGGKPVYRLPMLRQRGGLALSDFVAPESYGFDSPVGMFAISVREVGPSTDLAAGRPVGQEVCEDVDSTDDQTAGQAAVTPEKGGSADRHCHCGHCSMDYSSMMSRAVRLTLAEAASLWLDAWVKERLPEGSAAKVVKPAVGYASCPDHSLKRDILSLLPDADRLGISLTESCSMIPEASICGLIFIHPKASYPEVRRLSQSAVDDYARRRGMSETDKARFLGHLL